jgi:hypothetical protein
VSGGAAGQIKGCAMDWKMAFWQAIEASVCSLPHKIEWFDDSGQKVTEVHGTFIIPKAVADVFGDDTYLHCDAIARSLNCELFPANDGALVFKKQI